MPSKKSVPSLARNRKACVLAIDQGTTGTRAIIYNSEGRLLGSAYREITQYYPKPGWVEHDPEEIWESVRTVTRQALKKCRVQGKNIAAIGITNQRETTLLWNKKTGRSVGRAIVWQDRRTTEICDRLKKRGCSPLFRNRTGLVIDPYFSGTKIHWLLNHKPELRKAASKGQLLFGTIDTWLVWKLTGGKEHVTDFTNASRTLLLNIQTKKWDDRILKMLRIPKVILPQVKDSGSIFGVTRFQGSLPAGIPIASILGDQQAALFGQGCYHKGDSKNTYGTGCFLLTVLGKTYRKPPFGLLLTLACNEKGKTVYALEGSIFSGGSVIQWLRDGLGFLKSAAESETLARSVKDTGGVVLIPAFTGLGAPHWNPRVRGVISGITRGTTQAHITRAALEAIAHQSTDIAEVMERKAGIRIHELRVDGGACSNRLLMQMQADLLGKPVLVSSRLESTAWGAAKLAGKTVKLWPNLDRLDGAGKYKRFKPSMSAGQRQRERACWQQALRQLNG